MKTILVSGSFHLTTLRAAIIVGSGSASFEIIRDLVEKLPVMIAPRWLKTKSQPIAIRNVIEFLHGVLLNEETYDWNFDIGGPEVLTYNQMMFLYAEMKLPGEAWLEFNIKNNRLYQTATFRPRGLWGRVYWFLVWPFHGLIFKGMLKNIAK
ncbi:MAG: DUF2867 domain-containing protein [Tangfeifania sp.]